MKELCLLASSGRTCPEATFSAKSTGRALGGSGIKLPFFASGAYELPLLIGGQHESLMDSKKSNHFNLNKCRQRGSNTNYSQGIINEEMNSTRVTNLLLSPTKSSGVLP